jgi:hypothetical protein
VALETPNTPPRAGSLLPWPTGRGAMDAQPKIGEEDRSHFFFLCNFTRQSFIFNHKMGHMLDLAIVDKLNRVGFVVALNNTPEEESIVKSVSGPARHVGEADNRYTTTSLVLYYSFRRRRTHQTPAPPPTDPRFDPMRC